jgi:DME family drug/metabolite transporter
MARYQRALARRLAPEPPVGARSAGLAAVAISCTAWGAVGILVRHLDLAAVTIAFFRLAFASLAVLLVGLVRRGTLRVAPALAQWRRLLVLGVLMAANWWLFILAFQLTDVGVAVVLSFTWPLWLALAGRLLDLEPPDLATIAALLASVAGVALLALRGGGPPDARDLAGMACALFNSVSFTAMVLVSRSIDARLSSTALNFWQTTLAAVLLAPLALLGLQSGRLDAGAVGILVVLGAVMTGAGQTLFVRGMRILSPAETGVVSYLEPLSATVLAALLLGERPGPRGVAGIALLVGAGAFVVLRGPAPAGPGTGGQPVPAAPRPETRR